MKKTLLAAALALVASTGWAQSTKGTALDAHLGENSYTGAEGEYPTVYWKYTPTETGTYHVQALNNAYTTPYVYAGYENGDTIEQKGASATYPSKYYALKEGVTYYFQMTSSGTFGIDLSRADYTWEGHGLTETDPQTIADGGKYFLGDPEYTGYYNYPTYATYTPQQSGLLTLTVNDYLSSLTVDGKSYTSEYDQGKYVYKVPVTGGQAASLVFSKSDPFTFAASFSVPEAGSIDLPFDLVEGQNTLPAAFGDYYYAYTPAKVGFFTVSSDDQLTGKVQLLGSKTSTYATAESEPNSFALRYEISYSTSNTYYLRVSKTESTEAEQHFTFAMEDYAAGEKESNPIVISSLPSTQTLSNASGSYYYAVTVPAGTNKFLAVKANSDIAQSYTTVYIYKQGDGYYYGKSGQNYVRYDVSGADTDVTYLIYWRSYESSPIEFQVFYEDIAQGSVITNPITAKLGENTLVGNGRQYYVYTATRTGKLSITTEPGTSVSFPKEQSDNTYYYWDVTTVGSTYSIECTEGTTYWLNFVNAVSGQTFTLTEGDFAEGEVQSKPLFVSDTYQLTAAQAANIWLAYKAETDGKLSIRCNASYSPDNSVVYGRTTDSYLASMLKTVYSGGESVSTYEGTKAVSAGDTVLVHLQLVNAGDTTHVDFSMQPFGEGEHATTAYLLTLNQPLTTPAAPTRDAPVWVKVVANGDDVNISTSAYLSGYWYDTLDEAKADSEDESLYTSGYYDEDNNWCYRFVIGMVTKGEHYLKLTGAYEPVTLTLTSGSDITAAISSVTARDGQTAVQVYSLDGQRVANDAALKPGLYVVVENGTARKVMVK